MSKVGILVKDASGTLRSVLYNDSLSTGMKQIHDVDSIIPGTGKENLGKLDSVTGDTGVMILGKSSDSYKSIQISPDGSLLVKNTEYEPLKTQTVVSQDGTNEVIISNKNSTLFNIHIANTTSSFKFLKLYDNKDQFVAAMSIPKIIIGIAPGNTVFDTSTLGTSFDIGLSLAITNSYVDTDNSSTSLGDVILTIVYR